MRLFVGVELDEPLRAACAAAARALQDDLTRARANLDVRWVPAENLHVTLWFFGEVPDERAAAIAERLRYAWDVPSFTLTVSGAGVFPSSGFPQVVWLGVSAGGERVAELHRELTTRLLPLRFEPERRPYHPHVTIGRVKEARRSTWRAARATLAAAAVRPGSCEIRAVTLFRSRLSPGGARYEPVLRVPLKEC